MDCRFTVVFAPLPAEKKAAWRAAIQQLAMWLEETPIPAFPQIEERDLGEGAEQAGEPVEDEVEDLKAS